MPDAAEPERLAAGRAAALDAHVLGRPVPPEAAPWLAEVCPADGATAIGLDGAPDDWVDTLAWSGMPLARGPLRWGVDALRAEVGAPTMEGGRLLLPAPEVLAGLTSLALKPLRLFVAERLKVRLQAAPGIRLWLWPGRAVLLSQAPMPLAGFLYGPPEGHRAGLALDPWGHQIVTW